MHEIKTEGGDEDCSKDKKCLVLVIIQLSQKLYDDSKQSSGW